MGIRITVRDPDNGHILAVDVDDATVVEEIVESAAKYWEKPTGAYVVRLGSTILPGAAKISDVKATAEDILDLIPDPEGG